ncbi:MAG: discoidin domain-containing protein [Clostridia bacterium]|nr:discoidin domain-containing protein [Clostridia bacterium]
MKKSIRFIILSIILFAVSAGAFAPAAAVSSGGTEMSDISNTPKTDFDFNKNILISIFWPPTSEYINDEQYKYMADAEIDWVLGTGDGIGSKADQLKMLELCSKYGIGMCVGDDRFGGNLLKYKPEKIKKLVDEYKDVPGAYGYYMLDEPYNANTFIDAYKALKEADPKGYMHLNFLPGHAYASYEIYESQMNDWLRLCAGAGYPQEYIMYDMYPFPLEKGSVSWTPMLKNLESVRKVGLKNNVKTAMYIQSVSQTVAFRSLDREETLFEFNIGLAFGIKQFSYFTWFTPYNRNEPFDDGIITHTGVPNEKYTFICEIDKMVHNVGKTLINLDAYEVYETSDTRGAIELLPDGFFVHPTKKSDLTVSYLKDKTTGRNYCMAVNNFFNKKQNTALKFDDSITSLQYVSYEDGQLYDLPMENGEVKLNLGKGEAIIMALPEGYDYCANKENSYAPGDDLAKDALITCSSSAGANGWYMDNLNDGKRFANSAVNGWQSASKTGLDTITVDLGQTLEFNRIDLYPAGAAEGYGSHMPGGFTVSYSEDGETWRDIAKATGLKIHDNSAPSLKFNKVSGRYVKIEITECTGKISELCEIEIYNDDGTLPGTEVYKYGMKELDTGGDPVTYNGGNIAKGRPVTVSSYPESPDYVTWGWSPDFLTDGNKNNGWTSNVKVHFGSENANEYAIVDLGDEFSIEKIEIFKNGCWPKDFTVSVSSDGKGFTDTATEKNSKEPKKSYITEPENVHGRFVMINATKLRGTDADGFMLQLGEIEVYGKPYIDREAADEAVKLFTGNGGDENSAAFKAVKDALENEFTTQKELDILIKTMLSEAGVTEADTAAETADEQTAAEYEFEYFTESAEPAETETDTAPEQTSEEEETQEDSRRNTLKTGVMIGAALAAAALLTAGVIYLIKKAKK